MGKTTKWKWANGEVVTDNVTGFSGVVTGRSDYMTGCKQYFVQPSSCSEAGSFPEGHWLDEGRLTAAVEVKNTGGPQNAPRMSGRHA